MLTRILSKPAFYITLIVGIVLLFFFARHASGQPLLGVRTAEKNTAASDDYQKKSGVDGTAIGLVLMHLRLMGSGMIADASFDNAADILSQSSTLIGTNVITYLQQSSDKSAALQTYIKNLELLIAQSQSTSLDLQSEENLHVQQAAQCTSEKSVADSNFFQWLNQNDADLMSQWLSDSLVQWPCATTERIRANSYVAVLAKMHAITSALQQMDTILVTNQDLIIANIDLFSDSYLEKLTLIRDQIRTIQPAID